MLIKKIEKLREKPERERRRFAIGLSFSATLIIFVVWFSVIFPANSNRIIAKNNPDVSRAKSETPFGVMKDSLAQAYFALKGMRDETKVDLTEEYNRIREQVEKGELRMISETNNLGDS